MVASKRESLLLLNVVRLEVVVETVEMLNRSKSLYCNTLVGWVVRQLLYAIYVKYVRMMLEDDFRVTYSFFRHRNSK